MALCSMRGAIVFAVYIVYINEPCYLPPMKLLLIKAAGLAGIILLTSCDPQTCGTIYLANEASDTVILERNGGESIVVGPSQVKEIHKECGLARGSEPGAMASGLEAPVKNGAACKKDIRDGRNWTTTKSGKYQFEHRFGVNDNDF